MTDIAEGVRESVNFVFRLAILRHIPTKSSARKIDVIIRTEIPNYVS